MTPVFSSLMKSGRAALVALTLGTAAIAAMPVQAAEPSFNFQLGIGDDGGVMGFELNNNKRDHRKWRPIR